MESKKEHIRNVLIASSAAIPFAGGPLSVLLDKYLPNEIERRKDSLIKKLSDELLKIEKQIPKDKLKDESYLTVFIQVFQHYLSEHRNEKLIAFRNILINEAITNSKDFDEVSFYIRLVDSLTVDQIRILHLVYRKEIDGHCSIESDDSIYKYIQAKWPKIDKYYLQACVTELLRFFIISSSVDSLNGAKGHQLTSFGKKFVKYIFEPNKLYE